MRPISLRKVSEIRNDERLKNISILATGGCITSEHAMSFFRYGGNVI